MPGDGGSYVSEAVDSNVGNSGETSVAAGKSSVMSDM